MRLIRNKNLSLHIELRRSTTYATIRRTDFAELTSYCRSTDQAKTIQKNIINRFLQICQKMFRNCNLVLCQYCCPLMDCASVTEPGL